MIRLAALLEATAGEEAKRRGLKSIGFGRYVNPAKPNTVVARSVKGKLVAVKPTTAPTKKPKKTADVARTITAKKIGSAKGSNEGGFYLGADGKKRYVKFYRNPNQGKSEHLANSIYRELGIGAPTSHVFKSGAKEAFASDIIDGETLDHAGMSRAIANKILDGFAADVLMGNWDTIGLARDNILVGKDGTPYRIDSGGTFTFRAMGSPKPESVLHEIPEFEGFANPDINPEYSEVFRSAGLEEPEDLRGFGKQVQNILKLQKKVGGWKSYVKSKVPTWNDKQVAAIASMLDSRTKLLVRKAKEIG